MPDVSKKSARCSFSKKDLLEVGWGVGDCNPKCVVTASQVEVSVRRKVSAVQSRAEEEVKGRGPSPPWGWVLTPELSLRGPPGDGGVRAPPTRGLGSPF